MASSSSREEPMKVIEHLEKAKEPLISFEIIPPTRGGDLKSLMKLIEDLVEHEPPFIDITSHAAEVVYDETGDRLSEAQDQAQTPRHAGSLRPDPEQVRHRTRCRTSCARASPARRPRTS